MEQLEPRVSDLIEDVYAKYLRSLERRLEEGGSASPHTKALCLMALLEGESPFTGSGRRWKSDRIAVRETTLRFIDERYRV